MDLVETWKSIFTIKENEEGVIYRKLDVNCINSYIEYDISQNTVSLRMEIQDRNIKLPKCKGVKYKYENNSLIIYCDKKYIDIFVYFTNDIYESIKDKGLIENIKDILILKFDMWRYFFETGVTTSKELSKEVEIGLIGELITLKKLIIKEGEDIINYWNGPLFSKHDFNLPGITIESKATVIKDDNNESFINIHGLDQLYDINPLFLYVHLLEENIEEGMDLNDYINTILSFISEKNYNNFYKRLSSIGYLPDYKCKSKYNIKESNVYKVVEGFPRLPIMKGINKDIQYKVYLNYINEFKEYSFESGILLSK